MKYSPLHDKHVALGAKMADFGGWEMPIEYAGVLAEHTAVRKDVGVFDVSHLGNAAVKGQGAAAFVNACLTNDLGRISDGQAQYTLCCDEESGGVVDDLIAYQFGAEYLFLIPNAANTAEVVRRLQQAAPPGIAVTNEHENYAILAIQGPRSGEVVSALGLPHEHDYMSFDATTVDGRDVLICRTGYTGEHGYELVVRWPDAVAWWEAIAATGATPCGLGSRDTLRTEMGYPLHGNDLSPTITPNQARVGWAVGWDKPRFWGRAALLAERAAKPARLLWGLEALDRGIPRQHMSVLGGDGGPIGEVTSGTFSPTLRRGIGLALLKRSAGVTAGDEVAVDVRGRPAGMRVVKPPFVQLRTR